MLINLLIMHECMIHMCLCSGIQWCLTLGDLTGFSLPGCSVYGIFSARILEWGAISSSRASSQPKDRTRISCIIRTGRQTLYH